MSKARKMKKAGATSVRTPVEIRAHSFHPFMDGPRCIHCGSQEHAVECTGPRFAWVDAETVRIEFEAMTVELMDRQLSWPNLGSLPHIYEDLVREHGFDPIKDRRHVDTGRTRTGRRLGQVVAR